MSATIVSEKTSLRSVINEVTKEKLAWLETQRQMLKSHFAPVLQQYEEPKKRGSLKYLKEIHAAISSAQGDNRLPVSKKDDELTRFLSSIGSRDNEVFFGSNRLVEVWVDELIKRIKFRIEKCEYACLYATVMTQYMEMESTPDEHDDDQSEELGKKDVLSTKEETIKEFSKLVLSDSPTFDKEKFENFLNSKLFNQADQFQMDILERARERVREYCETFDYKKNANAKIMTVEKLKVCINGLLKEKVLSRDKIITLKELRENSAALAEVCTLMDKRIKNYGRWSWPRSVYVDFRRNIAGRYRAYHDEDIITALILHYLGGEWSILLKSVFKTIYRSNMWKHGPNISETYYRTNSIEGYRREFHNSAFLSILPDKMEDLTEKGAGYDDDDEEDGRSDKEGSYTSFGRGSRGRGRGGSSRGGHQDRGRQQKIKVVKNEFSPTEVKKKLLHLICNEIHLNNVLRPTTPLTVVQTDVEWFGPSIVHEALLSIMKFFGVTEEWLNFFKTFLETPLRIGSPRAQVQIRKRGSPISHTFTTLFGETILFTMDLYVNQVSGLNIYRIHDDFWFWSPNQDAVIQAWNAMQTFTRLVDLKLNKEKSASVVCSKDVEPGTITLGPVPLPQRQVKWGFIILHSDGVYRINKTLIEPQIKEMRKCLTQAETVMTWVHCHNKYIRFFIRNFLEPAKTLQRQHVVQIIDSLEWILAQVHQETNGDAVKSLKLRFPEIWGDKDVMDSWVHWPVHQGGLNLYNPFLHLIPLHEAYEHYENTLGEELLRFEEMVTKDEIEWRDLFRESRYRRKRRAECKYDEEVTSFVTEKDETVTDEDLFGSTYWSVNPKWGQIEKKIIKDHQTYYADKSLARKIVTPTGHGDEKEETIIYTPPKEENERMFKRIQKRVDYFEWCKRTRETRSERWRKTYIDLLSNVEASSCETGNWREWLYEDELQAKLGEEEEFVDPTLVPLSLISSIQEARVHKN